LKECGNKIFFATDEGIFLSASANAFLVDENVHYLSASLTLTKQSWRSDMVTGKFSTSRSKDAKDAGVISVMSVRICPSSKENEKFSNGVGQEHPESCA
jgi:GTP cyclohydrolase FolE2